MSLTLIQENVDALISAVRQEMGFSQGKPIATLIIYKSLLHWKTFEAEKTSVFDRLIQMIGSAIEVIFIFIFLYLFLISFYITFVSQTLLYFIFWSVLRFNHLYFIISNQTIKVFFQINHFDYLDISGQLVNLENSMTLIWFDWKKIKHKGLNHKIRKSVVLYSIGCIIDK